MFDRATPAEAEPDHRSAEADGIGEIAPVVAALFQCERSQGWPVAVAYVVGFFVMLAVLGWPPDVPR
jgi:hypothetical protein